MYWFIKNPSPNRILSATAGLFASKNVVWVPGNDNNQGNETADAIVKGGGAEAVIRSERIPSLDNLSANGKAKNSQNMEIRLPTPDNRKIE